MDFYTVVVIIAVSLMAVLTIVHALNAWVERNRCAVRIAEAKVREKELDIAAAKYEEMNRD